MNLPALIETCLRGYMLMIVARALFSWLPPRWRANEVYAFVVAATEPVLRPVRRALPTRGGVDWSPLLVLILLDLIVRLVF